MAENLKMDRESLKLAIAAAGTNATALSRKIGRDKDYVRDYINGRKESIGADEWAEIAKWLGTQLSDRPTGYSPPPTFLGQADLPVYTSVEGGPGEIVFGADRLDPIPRPWFVAHVPEAYAVLVVGESMVPAIKPGQLVIVNPRLAPIPGEHAIFSTEEHGRFRATVKELVRSTGSDWVVRQYNPPEGQESEFRLPKRDWPKAVRVIGIFAGR